MATNFMDEVMAVVDVGRKLLIGETTLDELGEELLGGGKPANDDGDAKATPAAEGKELEQARALATVTPIRR